MLLSGGYGASTIDPLVSLHRFHPFLPRHFIPRMSAFKNNFCAIYLLFGLCLFFRVNAGEVVDKEPPAIPVHIDDMPETAVFKQEMAALHQCAVRRIRNWLLKQLQVQIDARNYSKAATLEKYIARLDVEFAGMQQKTFKDKTFMDGRKWEDTKSGAVYTVRNRKLHCGGVELGEFQILCPCVLYIEQQHEFWVWLSQTEVMVVNDIGLRLGKAKGYILKSVGSMNANSEMDADLEKIVQERYQSFIRKNELPIRRKYTKVLSAKMDELAKKGDFRGAGEIQTYISALPAFAADAARFGNSSNRLVGEFVEIVGGNWVYAFNPEEWSSRPPNGGKGQCCKWLRTSPDGNVFVYSNSVDDFIEPIFKYNDRLVRISKGTIASHFTVRVIRKIK